MILKSAQMKKSLEDINNLLNNIPKIDNSHGDHYIPTHLLSDRSFTTCINTPAHNSLSLSEIEHIIENATSLHLCIIKFDTIDIYKSDLYNSDINYKIKNKDNKKSYAVIALLNEQLIDIDPLAPNCIPLAYLKITHNESTNTSIFSEMADKIFNTITNCINILTIKGLDITTDLNENKIKTTYKEKDIQYLQKLETPNKESQYPKINDTQRIFFLPEKLNSDMILFMTKIQSSSLTNKINEPIQRFQEASVIFELAQDFPDILNDDINKQCLLFERMTHAMICAKEGYASLAHTADYILNEHYKIKQFNEFCPERAIDLIEINRTCQIFQTDLQNDLQNKNKLKNSTIHQINDILSFFDKLKIRNCSNKLTENTTTTLTGIYIKNVIEKICTMLKLQKKLLSQKINKIENK